MSTTSSIAIARPSMAIGTARIQVLIGAIIVQLILGTVYGYSIFWEPLQAEVFPVVKTQAQAQQLLAAGEAVGGYSLVADQAAANDYRQDRRSTVRQTPARKPRVRLSPVARRPPPRAGK